MTAQNDPETFSEAEVYQALRWGMTGSEAERLAKYLGKELSQDERARWEKRRSDLRAQLIKAGKLGER